MNSTFRFRMEAVVFPEDIEALAREVLELARARRLSIATAESCTGGLVAGALTAIAGSSDVVMGGLVTYSNDAKHRLLGVESALLDRYGAVSEPVARAMASGAAAAVRTDLGVSTTGVAGPGGGSAEKPVGLVHFGAAGPGGAVVHREMRFGEIGREQIRLQSVRVALEMLRDLLSA
jgi:nicotinamide-nucleotide amidase